MTAFLNWFDKFIADKGIKNEIWTIKDIDGTAHIVDTNIVIEKIRSASEEEQEAIKNILLVIPNDHVKYNLFFHYLALGLVEKNKA